MELKEAAPWIGLVVVVVGQVGQYAVLRWRVGALDKWRDDVETFMDTIHHAKGHADAQHEDFERRIARLERASDQSKGDRRIGGNRAPDG